VGGLAGYEAAGRDNSAALANGPMRLVDVRHESTAVFAAEGVAKLLRTPGFAALTAGPGVTNGISGLTSAHFNGAPVVVVGGRAPEFRWGSGALQEIDHLPLVAPVTKYFATLKDPATIGADIGAAFAAATHAHRGPAFVDIPMDRFYTPAKAPAVTPIPADPRLPDPESLTRIATLIAAAERPVLVLGSDVWLDGAAAAARTAAETMALPIMPTVWAGESARGHSQLVSRARSVPPSAVAAWSVVATPLDFRLGCCSRGTRRAGGISLRLRGAKLSLHACPVATAYGNPGCGADRNCRRGVDGRRQGPVPRLVVGRAGRGGDLGLVTGI
jgi:acetolactate synthase-1/2/3 large subunit